MSAILSHVIVCMSLFGGKKDQIVFLCTASQSPSPVSMSDRLIWQKKNLIANDLTFLNNLACSRRLVRTTEKVIYFLR